MLTLCLETTYFSYVRQYSHSVVNYNVQFVFVLLLSSVLEHILNKKQNYRYLHNVKVPKYILSIKAYFDWVSCEQV